MADSKLVASLAGPIMVVLAGSLLFGAVDWDRFSDGDVYLMGVMLFVGGLLVVRFHNRWVAGWPVIITLAGWLFMAAGIFRLYLIDFVQQTAPVRELPFQVGLLGLGLFLTAMGYWPRRA